MIRIQFLDHILGQIYPIMVLFLTQIFNMPTPFLSFKLQFLVILKSKSLHSPRRWLMGLCMLDNSIIFILYIPTQL